MTTGSGNAPLRDSHGALSGLYAHRALPAGKLHFDRHVDTLLTDLDGQYGLIRTGRRLLAVGRRSTQ